MMYIKTGDLIGNAFISYLKQTGKRVLKLKTIEVFGEKVVDYLKKENGMKACLELSRDKTNSFFMQYSEWFTYVEKEGTVILNSNITTRDLIHEFSGYLNISLLLAFRNKENTAVLFEN